MYPYLYIMFTNLCIHTRVNHTRTPTRRSPFEGSSALNKGSQTVFLGIVCVSVGMVKEKIILFHRGGGISSSLARTHNHKTLGGIFYFSGGRGECILISIVC